MPESTSLPLIDVRALDGTDSAQIGDVVREIGAACRDIGFFYVVAHGVPDTLMRETFAMARDFFSLPEAQKSKASILASRHNRGYVAMQGERLDPSKPGDLKEAFNIGLEIAPDDPELLAGVPFRGLNTWPELPEFRSTMLAYFDAVWSLGRLLHRAFAMDLGLSPAYFEDKLDRPMATLRLLHYPEMPGSVAPGQLGAGEHTDYGNITLLATDDAGGLEVRRRDGTWLSAPPIPGAFVINIGDCLMRWSNDIYISTPHRVVNPRGRERTSIAFFLDPNPDALVAALPGTTRPGVPAKYPPVVAADYLRRRLDPSYDHMRKN